MRRARHLASRPSPRRGSCPRSPCAYTWCSRGRWAEQHGLSGDRGLFQGMIARFRASLPAEPPATLAAAEHRISVFVRCRPLLEFELKAGGFEVVTVPSRETSPTLIMHEPKTMVDLSKAMDNHTCARRHAREASARAQTCSQRRRIHQE